MKIPVENLRHLITVGILLYSFLTVIIFFSEGFRTYSKFPSFLDSLCSWKTRAAGTLIIGISILAYFIQGQIAGFYLSSLNKISGILFNLFNIASSLLIYASLYVPRIDNYAGNGILFCLSFFLLVINQFILFFVQKKETQNNCHSIDQILFIVVDVLLLITWIVFYAKKLKYYVAAISYIIAFTVFSFCSHINYEVTRVKVSIKFDDQDELPQ